MTYTKFDGDKFVDWDIEDYKEYIECLQRALDNSIVFNPDDARATGGYCTIKLLNKYMDKCEVLEKALDKACGELEALVDSEIYGGDEEEWGDYPTLKKEQWKEWLLKDE